MMLLPLLLGALFGFGLFYAHASNPDKVLQMLRLRDLSLMKTILFAIGLASTLIYISHQMSMFDISHLSVKGTNLGVVLGGMIFGLGFGLVGSCPGTSLAALTSGFFRKVIAIVVGGIFGALLFSLSFGFFEGMGLFKAMNFGNLTWFKLSPKFPAVFDIGFTGLLISGLLFMFIAAIIPAKR